MRTDGPLLHRSPSSRPIDRSALRRSTRPVLAATIVVWESDVTRMRSTQTSPRSHQLNHRRVTAGAVCDLACLFA